MRALTSSRPSPTVIAGALILALAIASNALAGSELIQSKVTKASVKKIARKQVRKAAPGLEVASSDSPYARALIKTEPLEVRFGRNIAQAQVTNPRVGTYCFDLAFSPSGVQVTSLTESQAVPAIASAVLDPLSFARTSAGNGRGSAFNGCMPGTDLQVTMTDPVSGLNVNAGFFVAVAR